MTTIAALAHRALPHAEQGIHAELLHRLDVEHLDRDAVLLQRGRAPGEFVRIEDVGRLVDEVARDDGAFVIAAARVPRPCAPRPRP